MLNILTGIWVVLFGFVKFIPRFIISPTFARLSKDHISNIVMPTILLLGSGFLIFGAGYWGPVNDEPHRYGWALYGLYTIAILAGTNLLSGFYEIGRWKRNKKTEEAQNKQEKVVEAAKEAPVSMDSLGSLLTEVDALPPGISEKQAEKLLAKISAAHAGGELTPTEFNSLNRMVYRRIVSA